ncbi:MAG: M48 family metallopeptidase [Bdellovibrionota bacterium]
MKRLSSSIVVALGLLSFFVACSRTPVTGRKQLDLIPDSQLSQMGQQAWLQVGQSTPQLKDPEVEQYVQQITTRIVATVSKEDQPEGQKWDLAVFNSDQINAFALPGGHIGVYAGILPVAQNEAGLAAVIGHEVAHVIANHHSERVSQQLLSQGILTGASAALGSTKHHGILMGALGLGAQVGVLLPYSRKQESEADEIGLRFMAMAGYDPHEAVDFWKRMQEKAGGSPPALLATHPSSEERIRHLTSLLPVVAKLYVDAPTKHGIGRPAPKVALEKATKTPTARSPAAKPTK